MIVKSILFISFPQVLYGTVHHSFHFTRHFLKRYKKICSNNPSCQLLHRLPRRLPRGATRLSRGAMVVVFRGMAGTSWLSVQAAGRRLDVNSVGNGCKMLINAVYTPLTPIHLVSPIHILYTKPWSLQRGNWLPHVTSLYSTFHCSKSRPYPLRLRVSSASTVWIFLVAALAAPFPAGLGFDLGMFTKHLIVGWDC